MSPMNDPAPKPWYKRTELWLTLGASIFGALVDVDKAGSVTLGTAAGPIIAAIMKVLGVSLPIGFYTISRGIAKAGSGN